MAEYVIIGADALPMKDRAPYVPSGVSLQGCIEWDHEDDKLRCHECGRWFADLGSHIKVHGLSGPEYKAKHCLGPAAALAVARLRRIRSECMTRQVYAEIETYRERLKRITTHSHPGPQPGRVAWLNKRRLCTAQVRQQVKEVAAKLGRVPTVADLCADGMPYYRADRVLKQCLFDALMGVEIVRPKIEIVIRGQVSEDQRQGD